MKKNQVESIRNDFLQNIHRQFDYDVNSFIFFYLEQFIR